MPKIEDILKLIEAGYSKDEITALTAEVKTEVTPEVKAEEPAEQPEPKTEPAEVPSEGNDELLRQLTAEMAELRKQIQKRNLSETFTDTPKPERSQEILASLINPKKEENKR